MKKGNVGRVLGGVAVGAALGVLFAPKSGSETRKELKQKLNELIDKAKTIDINEVKDNILNKIDEIKEELQDLDKEKVLELAKKQGDKIKEKADELVKYAKEKGTPVLEKAASDAREKTIEVLKETINKLEDAQKKSTSKTKTKKA